MIARIGHHIFVGMTLGALVSACGSSPAASAPPADAPVSLDTPAIDAALKGVSADRIKQHMTVLASDELEGRGLGSKGYEAALQYVEKTLTADGLAPAGENGSSQ